MDSSHHYPIKKKERECDYILLKCIYIYGIPWTRRIHDKAPLSYRSEGIQQDDFDNHMTTKRLI